MVQIVDVQCANCGRKFRTVPSVVEHAGAIDCPVCGVRMKISREQPVSVLAQPRDKATAA